MEFIAALFDFKNMTSACAAPQRMVNPLLAGGYAAEGHQTFRRITDLA